MQFLLDFFIVAMYNCNDSDKLMKSKRHAGSTFPGISFFILFLNYNNRVSYLEAFGGALNLNWLIGAKIPEGCS
jgi:hypothetical protein